MIRSLIKHLPPIEQLKQEVKQSPQLLDTYLAAEIITGDIDSVEFILNIKQQLDSKNDKSN